MLNPEDKTFDEKGTRSSGLAAPVSRREFLKIAGLAGATIGLGAGLGGILAACGEETTTTSAGETSSTAGETSSTEASATTSVSASGEAGREIKIGWVAPITGAIAQFGLADQYAAERWTEAVANGLVCGDGKTHPIKIITMDSQSDSNRAGQVAGDLINNEGVDILMAASTADTCNPVADQAEANGCPCFTNDAPWQDFFYGRNGDPEVGFKWTYHNFWGIEDICATYMDIWDQLPTNKVVGGLWPNDAEGNAWGATTGPFDGMPPIMEAAGYKVVDPGRYPSFTEDFTSQITEFKNAGVEILTGVPLPPDFANFWKQALQQGFKPKIVTIGRALLFPEAVEAIGDTANLTTTEVWWTPTHPFKSSLTGETCKELADDWETRTGKQWTGALFHYAVFEVVHDALKRCTNVDDKEAIIEAIATTKMETIGGPVDFTAPIAAGSMRPNKNCYRSPCVGGQWIKGTGKWKFDEIVISNVQWPDVPLAGKLQEMAYGA